MKGARAAIVAGIAAVVLHFGALGNGFAYDDVPVVAEDSALVRPGAFPERLAEPYWPGEVGGEHALWRPLTTAAFAVQARVAGLEPPVFHATNVVLHGVVTALVVLLAAGVVSPGAALLAGLVFATHPVHVEAVANVVGLSELLAAAFYLAACVVFVRGRAAAAAVAAVAGLYAAAFLSKESAVTLPAALLVIDLVRRPVAPKDVGSWVRRQGPLLAALAAVAVAVLVVRWTVLGSFAPPEPPLGARRLEGTPRIWTLGVVWSHVIRLLVAPFELSADYSPGVVPVLTVWTPGGVVGVAVVLLLLGSSLVAWRRAAPGEGLDRAADADPSPPDPGGPIPALRLPALVVLWVVVTMAPVSNTLFLSGVLLAERTLYLPSVAVAIAAGAGLVAVARRRRLVGAVAVATVLGAFAVRSWTRVPEWESTRSVMLGLVADHPESGRGRWMLGDTLAAAGKVTRAKRHWAAAIGLLDSDPALLRELGTAALTRGEARLGEHLLGRALAEDTSMVGVRRRLAVLHAARGRHAEAVEEARRVVETFPGDVASWHLLAGSLEATGRLEEAVAARERVIELGEDAWQQWMSLAGLRLRTGDERGATDALGEALERAPGDAERATIRAAFEASGARGEAPDGG